MVLFLEAIAWCLVVDFLCCLLLLCEIWVGSVADSSAEGFSELSESALADDWLSVASREISR